MKQEIKLLTLDGLTPYDKNAKRHPDKQIEKIAASIAEFGFRQPILIDEKNVIISGHGRYLAAKLLKLREVPTVTINDLTPAQIKAFRLADNKVAESGWDNPLVQEELLALKDEDYTLHWLEESFKIKEEEYGIKAPEAVSFTPKDLKCPKCGAEGPKKIFKIPEEKKQ